ncbi:hypothetical protein SAMN05421664_0260 [Chryseobacterium soldanellicola]|uniref:Uncharacterized protein n=1 Tax=Chryseobacterium soldanellicola TaxID=311333 RepID=A0A1H0XU77_9FLAO|nr:hypothetical protein [Chryseobacterium soldanellicola]SDQ06415.1 hypothetical protein SAMN05421664_0260 [Chryseobacterium soldanellicola]
MKIRYCWRCKMDVPMLDEEEGNIASQLYTEGFQEIKKTKKHTVENFKKLLDYYKDLTGFEETNPNAIMHHFIDMYGPNCENCGKPYRTKTATFCPKCGNKRKF